MRTTGNLERVGLWSSAWLVALALLGVMFGATRPREALASGATITVAAAEVAVSDNDACSLLEAIENANHNAQVSNDDCPAGSGEDTISLAAASTYLLTGAYANTTDPIDFGDTGTPFITSTMTIEGNGATIRRDMADTDKFRLMMLVESSTAVNLTLRNLTLEGGELVGNPGGALAVTNGSVTADAITVTRNTVNALGGGIYLSFADLRLSNSVISGNRVTGSDAGASNGGGIRIHNSTAILTDTVVMENEAATHGGGIYAGSSSVLKLTRVEVLSNTAALDGGGIRSQAALTVIDSTISHNQSGSSGAGLAATGGSVSVSGTTISDNTNAGSDGGGIMLSDNSLVATFTDCTISDNATSKDGGGLSINKATSVTITGSEISGNSSQDGAGIFNGANSKLLTISDSQILSNTATLDGGGFETLSTKDLSLTRVEVRGNSAGDDGAGLLFSDGTATVTESRIINNQSTDDGAGIYVGSAGAAAKTTLTISGSDISGNVAGNSGGGFRIKDAKKVTVVNSTVSGNRASDPIGDGGGFNITVEPNNVILRNVTVSGNFAGDAGGGIYSGGVATLDNVSVVGNTAAGTCGGGLCVFSNSVTLNRSLVAGNVAENAADEVEVTGGTLTADEYNVFGHGALSAAAAYAGFTPGASDVDASSDGLNEPLVVVVDTTPADNGGTTRTNALPPGSPAIDVAPNAACAAAPINGLDQRGESRNVDVVGFGSDPAYLCDAGAYEARDYSAITIQTYSDPAGLDDVFNFTSNINGYEAFSLSDTLSRTMGVAAGMYTVTEQLSNSFVLLNLTCSGGSTIKDWSTNRVVITVVANETVQCTYTNFLDPITQGPPPTVCTQRRTDILGTGMGNAIRYRAAATVKVPSARDVVTLVGQFVGDETGAGKGYIVFTPSRGSAIIDTTIESPAYRQYADYWFSQVLTPTTATSWKASQVTLATRPYQPRAFLLYPTYKTKDYRFDYVSLPSDSAKNHVFWDVAGGWAPEQTFTINLPKRTHLVQDVRIVVAIADNAKDNHPIVITVHSAGQPADVQPVSLSRAYAGPNKGSLLNIVTFQLKNVPSGTKQFIIRVSSPANSGDSASVSGYALNMACPYTH